MIYYCPDCNRIYKNYQRDITQTYYVHSIIKNGKLIEQEVIGTDINSFSYCICNPTHKNLKFIQTSHLNLDELNELMSYFTTIHKTLQLDCIEPEHCTASTLARLQVLIKLNEVIT